ncbi:MAG: NUDIX hydrolase, partial [Planctomycetota bacterium]
MADKQNDDPTGDPTEPNILIHCRRFHVERVERQIGEHVDVRDVIRHPGSVVLLPIIDDGHICLIRNHRIAVGRTLLELPAGTRETNEPPEETARRELIEETGYRCEQLVRMLEFYPAPGMLDEQMILYRAEGLVAGAPERELGEQIENQ